MQLKYFSAYRAVQLAQVNIDYMTKLKDADLKLKGHLSLNDLYYRCLLTYINPYSKYLRSAIKQFSKDHLAPMKLNLGVHLVYYGEWRGEIQDNHYAQVVFVGKWPHEEDGRAVMECHSRQCKARLYIYPTQEGYRLEFKGLHSDCCYFLSCGAGWYAIGEPNLVNEQMALELDDRIFHIETLSFFNVDRCNFKIQFQEGAEKALSNIPITTKRKLLWQCCLDAYDRRIKTLDQK